MIQWRLLKSWRIIALTIIIVALCFKSYRSSYLNVDAICEYVHSCFTRQVIHYWNSYLSHTHTCHRSFVFAVDVTWFYASPIYPFGNVRRSEIELRKVKHNVSAVSGTDRKVTWHSRVAVREAWNWQCQLPLLKVAIFHIHLLVTHRDWNKWCKPNENVIIL